MLRKLLLVIAAVIALLATATPSSGADEDDCSLAALAEAVRAAAVPVGAARNSANREAAGGCGAGTG